MRPVDERSATTRVPTCNKGPDVLDLAAPLWAFIGPSREAGGDQKGRGAMVTAVQKLTVPKAPGRAWDPGLLAGSVCRGALCPSQAAGGVDFAFGQGRFGLLVLLRSWFTARPGTLTASAAELSRLWLPPAAATALLTLRKLGRRILSRIRGPRMVLRSRSQTPRWCVCVVCGERPPKLQCDPTLPPQGTPRVGGYLLA